MTQICDMVRLQSQLETLARLPGLSSKTLKDLRDLRQELNRMAAVWGKNKA